MEPASEAAEAIEAPQKRWGIVAAVRRTLLWASADPDRLGRLPFIGASCAASEEGDPWGQVLAETRGALLGLDAMEPEARLGEIERIQGVLEQLVPVTQIGARLPRDGVRARIVPDRRALTREAREGRARREPPPSSAAPSAPAEAAPVPPSPQPVASAAASARQPMAREPRREGARSPSQPRRQRAEPAEAPPAPSRPPQPVVLPLSHPERGGRLLSEVAGISVDLVRRLEELGMETVQDLLLSAPEDFDRWPTVQAGRAVEGGGLRTFRGKVLWRCTRLGPGSSRAEVALGTTEERLLCRWVHDKPRGFDHWRRGDDLAFVGELIDGDENAVLYEAEPVGLDGRGSGLMPRYGMEGIEDAEIRGAVALIIRGLMGVVEDLLPAEVVERNRLLALDEALRDAHFPANASGRGRVRMAFEELLLLQVGVAWKAGRGQPERGIAHKGLHAGVAQLEIQHGIKLDDGQEIAFSDIRRDMLKPVPMARLLQGDVGAGKGMVALMSAVVAAENRSQVAMILPDGMAAERRYLFAESLLRGIGVVPLLAGDKPGHAQLDAIRRGEAHVVFGTLSLLSSEVEWRRLGLVIAEERGSYGTVRPAELRAKGTRPDLLVLTRAPIPSSLTFSVFGEFDVSVVPLATRPRVACQVVEAGGRAAIYAEALAHIEAGRQAFVVLPVRGGRDLLSTEDALRMAEALRADTFPGARIGVYCTPMSREERFQVFDDFQHRRIDVLVATTHIEDAPPVDNASVMLVEYADLHDAVRLHRLRSHVGYGRVSGMCAYILSDSPSAEGAARVALVNGERDGFRLSEHDLQQRGAEALLGDRASEMPNFDWADPPRDRELLLRARGEAFRMLQGDPGLRRNPEIAKATTGRWGGWLGDLAPRSPQSDPKLRRRRRRRRR